MAHKQAGGKSLMIQRKWPKLGIPRLYRSSGTDKVGVKKRIEAMLDTLAAAAKADDQGAKHVLLTLYLAGGDLMGMLATYEGEPGGPRGIDALKEQAPTVRNDQSIDRPNFDHWLKGLDIRPQTAESYRHQHAAIMRHAGQRGYMSDLPFIMRDYRAAVLASGKGRRAFNYGMTVARSWAKQVGGRQSKAYLDLLEVPRLKVAVKTARQRPRWSPRFVQNMMALVPPHIADAIWFQVVHGMNSKEMMVDGYEQEGAHGLRITGEKRGARDRTVPLMAPVMRSPFNRDKFRLEYKHYLHYVTLASEALAKPMRTHDLRRCYSRWIKLAKVTPLNIPVYLGHAFKTDTERYQLSEIDEDEELALDAETFNTWLKAQLEKEKAPEELPPPVLVIQTARRKGAKVKQKYS